MVFFSSRKQAPQGDFAVSKTDEQWKAELPADVYQVTRQHKTEPKFTGKWLEHKEVGCYVCVCCGQPLFDSSTKFDSGTGWPSFYAFIGQSVGTQTDTSWGMKRQEVHCSKCASHLGHCFEDGPEPTGLRYCINSLSLDFKKKQE